MSAATHNTADAPLEPAVLLDRAGLLNRTTPAQDGQALLRNNSNLLRECRQAHTILPHSPPTCTDLCSPRIDPHIGHLHSQLLADVFARYSALRNPTAPKPVMLTGTDEHGLKIQRVAEAQGVTPIGLCDRVSQTFLVSDCLRTSSWGRRTIGSGLGWLIRAGCGFAETGESCECGLFNFHAHDRGTPSGRSRARLGKPDLRDWVRSRHRDHEANPPTSPDPQRQLRDKGLIYKSSYAGWYAVSDEAYYPAAQVGEVIDDRSGEKYMVSSPGPTQDGATRH